MYGNDSLRFLADNFQLSIPCMKDAEIAALAPWTESMSARNKRCIYNCKPAVATLGVDVNTDDGLA